MHWKNWREIIARIFIGVVLFFNVQCAIVFLATPDAFSGAFELEGVAGRAMVQGMGLLFLMWNVPYFMALIRPFEHNLALGEAIVMQVLGFCGEWMISWGVPTGHTALFETVSRFMWFDGLGVLALLAAARLVRYRFKLFGAL